MTILGIETSCDETAAALLDISDAGEVRVVSNTVISQITTHKKYGGIVPEVAARKQMEGLVPVLEDALPDGARPDVIAATYGPGLVTALRVGLQSAKTLAYSWGVPLVGVNHIEGHIYSALLEAEEAQLRSLSFPTLAMIVSGGHTELILMKGHGHYELIGRTRDDAAGEAFDKVAKLLGLEYPGGPVISRLAENGNAQAIDFPRPMTDKDTFDFSFSGLKTAVLYHIKEHPPKEEDLPDICASFQQAVIDVLVSKTIRAAQKHNVKHIVLGGGVAANTLLRDTLSNSSEKLGIPTLLPERKYTTDNGTMIALAGYFNYKEGARSDWRTLVADPNLKLC